MYTCIHVCMYVCAWKQHWKTTGALSRVQNDGLKTGRSLWGMQKHGLQRVYYLWKVNHRCNKGVRGMNTKARGKRSDPSPPDIWSPVWIRQEWIWLQKCACMCTCMNLCAWMYICGYLISSVYLLFGHSFVTFLNMSQKWNGEKLFPAPKMPPLGLSRKGLQILVGIPWL